MTTAASTTRSTALANTLAAVGALSLLGALLSVVLSYRPPVERRPSEAPRQHVVRTAEFALA